MKTNVLPMLLVSVVAAMVVLAYSACSPRITIAGDKDHPIPIEANIKIDIYQHAVSDVDKMMEGLDEKPEEPEDAGDDGASIMLLRRVFAAVSVPSAYAAEADVALEKATELYRKAFPCLKSGILGENRDGYLALVGKAPNATQPELAEAAKLADQVNEARKQLYENRAKRDKTDIRSIQATFAKAFRDRSPKGVWIETFENNAWVWKQK